MSHLQCWELVSEGLAYGSKGLVCVKQECANLVQATCSTGCCTLQGICGLDLSADMLAEGHGAGPQVEGADPSLDILENPGLRELRELTGQKAPSPSYGLPSRDHFPATRPQWCGCSWELVPRKARLVLLCGNKRLSRCSPPHDSPHT